MANNHRYGLFDVFGIELEYMIVDKNTLKVKPVADQLLKEVEGEFVSDHENGRIAWSNELVAHVIELKTNGPAESLNELPELFAENIRQISSILDKYDAMLLPTAAHPLMDPYNETKIWPHEYKDIYNLYNKVFDCRGHGWSNLQSTHINLPFRDDQEFAKLHAAVRLLLPIIPAVAASSPILDGEFTGWLDSRMETYLHNQEKIPSMTGRLIPEKAYSQYEYYEMIFNPIIRDFSPYDTDHVTDHHFLNSRGAIARFDRGAIEIRVMDIQESPAADIALVSAITELIKLLVYERWGKIDELKKWDEEALRNIFLAAIKYGELSVISNSEYLKVFGINREKMIARDLWKHLLDEILDKLTIRQAEILHFIINNGTLASRIMKSLGGGLTKKNIARVYRELSVCLLNNTLFDGRGR